MLHYPHINKIAFELGFFKVYWYGIMYLLGFAIAWVLAYFRIKAQGGKGEWTTKQLEDLIFYSAIGVIVGGRLGYLLFYELSAFLREPLLIFKIWQGGMSFHGGLLGVIFSCYFFSRKYHRDLFATFDFLAPLAPLGIAFGRIGNFINGELWGRVTDVPWAMVFPNAGPLPRHPSQLYEFFLEGIFLFLLLWFYSARKKPKMAVSAVFLLGYGSLRFFVEFFRAPDPQYGFFWKWFTMGQILSIPMIIIGIVMLVIAYTRHPTR